MVYENRKETVYKIQFFLIAQRIQGQSTHRTINKVFHKVFGQLQKIKASVNTEDKGENAKAVVEVKFVSTIKKDQNAKTVIPLDILPALCGVVFINLFIYPEKL